jgi:hypothetical protein
MLELAARCIGDRCSRVLRFPAGQTLEELILACPLPDGDQYLGFIFAEVGTQHKVEQGFTAARDQLRVIIG